MSNITNKESLLSFFEAENKRDWVTYRKFLSADVVLILHSGHIKTIMGIEAYLSTIMKAYEDNANSFICEAIYQSEDDSRFVTILKNNLGERSCDVFEFSNGLIINEYEFVLA